jgi:hypothetical protein
VHSCSRQSRCTLGRAEASRHCEALRTSRRFACRRSASIGRSGLGNRRIGSVGERSRPSVPPPSVSRLGTKKAAPWAGMAALEAGRSDKFLRRAARCGPRFI